MLFVWLVRGNRVNSDQITSLNSMFIQNCKVVTAWGPLWLDFQNISGKKNLIQTWQCCSFKQIYSNHQLNKNLAWFNYFINFFKKYQNEFYIQLKTTNHKLNQRQQKEDKNLKSAHFPQKKIHSNNIKLQIN